MEALKVHLSEEKETLLITLYARAMDFRQERPLLGDRTAEELVRRIDYDFPKLKLSLGDSYAIVIRAKQLDLWTSGFLAEHPDSTVLHLGCGLDSRAIRVDPPRSVRWFDVDYPEVIELRRRLYPEREGYQMIASSVTDPGWLEEVPNDLPVMVLAEGLTPYLTRSSARELFNRLTDRFATGQMAFDVLNRLAGKEVTLKPSLRATGATFGWLVDDPAEIEQLAPRLRLVERTTILGSPWVARMPRGLRVLCRAMSLAPALRNLMQLLRYRF